MPTLLLMLLIALPVLLVTLAVLVTSRKSAESMQLAAMESTSGAAGDPPENVVPAKPKEESPEGSREDPAEGSDPPQVDADEESPRPANFSSADISDTEEAPSRPSNPYAALYGGTPVQNAAAPKKDAASYGSTYPGKAAAPARPPVPRPPKPPKKPFSPIPLLLIAGVCFLFLGGIIFLTSTWDALPDMARALILLSMSFLFFGVNLLAERIMKLPKTGLAFYILGCIFLPLTLGGIGVFRLMGEWLSFSGDGRFLLCGMICLCISLPSLIGQSNYKSPFLAWLGLTGISGMWIFLALFLDVQLHLFQLTEYLLCCILLTLFAAASTVCTELCLRRSAVSPLSKACRISLYTQNIVFSFFLIALSSRPGGDIPACILGFLTAVLFLYPRFISGKFHGGIFGFCLNLLISLTALADLMHDKALESILFVITGAAVILMAFQKNKYLPEAASHTFGTAGIIAGIFAEVGVLISLPFSNEIASSSAYWLLLVVPALIAFIHFSVLPHKATGQDHFLFCLQALLLYTVIMYSTGTADSRSMLLVPIFSALLLLGQFFLQKHLRLLILAVCSCCGLLLLHLPQSGLLINWLCTAVLSGALIYAVRKGRTRLEAGCGLAGIPMLLLSCGLTFGLFLPEVPALILSFTVLVLLYCLLFSVFWKIPSAEILKQFIANSSIWFCTVIYIAAEAGNSFFGWMLLLAFGSLFFAGINFRRPNNAVSIAPFLLSFLMLNSTIQTLSEAPGILYNLPAVQALCYLAILLILAAMGRILQPEGFYIQDGSHIRIDWALICGVLPIFSIGEVIDWCPSVLTSLFLSIYSLMYIGRVQKRYIPTLLASLFGCMAISFHNAFDPFHILYWLDEINIKSPAVLLTLLPFHVFILSLLWILPRNCRRGVHTARFCMYCITMVSLLGASLSFGVAADAIILASFSLAILLGSFAVKKLRWFTLGFSVLFLMTLKMTWSFWRSLHWGIYLFLVGALLIGIAFYYEYAIRRKANNPDAPEEKKVQLFKEWTW